MTQLPVFAAVVYATVAMSTALDARANVDTRAKAIVTTATNMTQLTPVSANATHVASATNATDLPRILPQVTSVMQAAQKTFEALTLDSKNLKALVSEQQATVKKLLRAHKSQFESTIRHQAKVNEDEWNKNKLMRTTLNASFHRVAKLRRQNQAVNVSNIIMRNAMGQLLTKVDLATDFLDQVHTEVEGLERSEIEAIRPTTPEPTLEYYLGKERDNLGLSPSFLQLGSQRGLLQEEEAAPNMSQKQHLPDAMLESLSRLTQADQHAENLLATRFQEVQKAQEQRHMRLTNDTERLNGTLLESTATEDALINAKEHLSGTNSNLRTRLHSLEAFYKQVSAAMIRTLEEADAVSSTVRA